MHWTLVVLLGSAGCRGAGARPSAGDSKIASTLPTNDLNSIRVNFYRALDGDLAALAECEAAASTADASVNPSPVRLAYRGACEMLEAAAAPLPWDKGTRSKRGLTMLDDAVAAAPADLEVRFLRGMTCAHLPRFFGRADQAAADLDAVAQQAEAAAADGRLELPVATAALFHAGVFAEQRGEPARSRELWTRAAKLGPATRAGRAAAEKLNAARS